MQSTMAINCWRRRFRGMGTVRGGKGKPEERRQQVVGLVERPLHLQDVIANARTEERARDDGQRQLADVSADIDGAADPRASRPAVHHRYRLVGHVAGEQRDRGGGERRVHDATLPSPVVSPRVPDQTIAEDRLHRAIQPAVLVVVLAMVDEHPLHVVGVIDQQDRHAHQAEAEEVAVLCETRPQKRNRVASKGKRRAQPAVHRHLTPPSR